MNEWYWIRFYVADDAAAAIDAEMHTTLLKIKEN